MNELKDKIDKANAVFNEKVKLDTPLQSHIIAEVENKPQKLRFLRPISVMLTSIPSDMSDVGRETLQNLFSCFAQQKHVSEGLVGDVLWGFGQCGHDPTKVIHGLMELESKGYLKFQAKDGAFINFNSPKIRSAWVRYQKKLTDMVYEVRDG